MENNTIETQQSTTEILKNINDLLTQVMNTLSLTNEPPKITILEDTFIEGKQLEEHFGVSERTIRRWRISDDLPFTEIGQRRYYELSDVVTFLRSKKGNAKAKEFIEKLIPFQEKLRNDKQRRNTK